jgi:hypothetical protein
MEKQNRNSKQTRSAKQPAFVRPPLPQEKKDELDAKYTRPELMGKFTCYFGKYREKATFVEVANDIEYTQWVMGVDPKSSNMYLFQRFVKAQLDKHP